MPPARLLTGRGLEFDLVCRACDEAEEPDVLTEICEGCAERLVDDGEMLGWRGQPGMLERPEPLDRTVLRWRLPSWLGEVTDLVPVDGAGRSSWLALTADGRIAALEPDEHRATVLATVELPGDVDHKPWAGHALRRRLHASACGRFAAVVHDYGRYGRVVDLARGGAMTLALDGGGYHANTVPFALVFAVHRDRPVVVHRTAWNRLDVSDPATGRLLTAREYEQVPERTLPPHYMDYFHGHLLCSPDGRVLADDGWVWSPVGVPVLWDLDRWLETNIWESEDGPSRYRLCHRAYYWDAPMCFVGDDTLAVGGIGDDDEAMLAGVRMFSVASGTELTAFAGPSGAFFSDGLRLYSAQADGLHVWDPVTGHRTGTVPGFAPSCLHRGTGELAVIEDGALCRWRTGRPADR